MGRRTGTLVGHSEWPSANPRDVGSAKTMSFSQRLFVFMACFGVLNCSTTSWAAEPAEKMKWNFQNIEVKALLQSLAEIGKQNLIVADGVAGQVSLHLNDMTWREALDLSSPPGAWSSRLRRVFCGSRRALSRRKIYKRLPWP